MLMEHKISVKDELQILPLVFGVKNRASNRREVKGREVEQFMRSVEMKNFSF